MGKPLAITRTEYAADDLRALASKSRDAAQVRRLLGLACVLDRRSRTEAADQAGMDRQTLRDWVHRYNADGVEGLKSSHGPGKPPSLTGEQMAELKATVLKGPDPDRHGVVRWRCVDLRAEVARRFAVEVTERTIGKWLRKLELTRLQPRPFHPKKDEAAQATFKKRARIGGPPVAVETGRAIFDQRGAAEKFLVDLTP
jgi:transposase